MSNAAKHRKRAAEFELQKQFDKAIASYVRAIEVGDAEGAEVDVALLNKVGDLTLRLGRVPEAVESYERAVEHYAAVGLFNNAIALCNKILRHAPGRVGVYLTLGRVCARKGMRGDATRNFLEYAARMQQEGRVDEGMRALAEVAAAMPELEDVKRLVEEHATRVGIALPASAADAAVGAGNEALAKSAESLVFLDVDYDAAVELTPAYGAAAVESAPPLPTSRSAASHREPPPRTSSLDDLLIFDPTSIGEDDGDFADALDGLEVTHSDVDTLLASETPSLLAESEATDQVDAMDISVGLTDALGFATETGDAESSSIEVLDGLVADDEAPLLPEALIQPATQEFVDAPVTNDALASDETIELPGPDDARELVEALEPADDAVEEDSSEQGAADMPAALSPDLSPDTSPDTSSDTTSDASSDTSPEMSDDSSSDPALHSSHELTHDEAAGPDAGLSPSGAEATPEIIEGLEIEEVVWLDVASDDLMSDVMSHEEPVELFDDTIHTERDGDGVVTPAESADELPFLVFDRQSGDVPVIDFDLGAIETVETEEPLEFLDVEALQDLLEEDQPTPSATPYVSSNDPYQRLNPHDFILPGELPPIVYPDDLLASAIAAQTRSVDTPPVDTPLVEFNAFEINAFVAESHPPDEPVGTDVDLAQPREESETPTAAFDLESALLTPHDSASALEFLADDETAAEDDRVLSPPDDEVAESDDLGDLEAILTPRTPAVAMNLALDRCARLREEVEAHPGDWARRRRLAEAYLEAGELTTGLAELAATVLALESEGNLTEASRIADQLIRVAPDVVPHHLKRVELAVRMGDRDRLRDGYLDLADAMVRTGQALRAESVYVRVLELDPWDDRARAALGEAAPPPPAPKPAPPGADDGYVSLSDWLSDDAGSKDTRMRVKEPTVTGDEDADFTRMLQHFREGVSRSLGDEDYATHYDLGVAYKEMGLLDDAIAEFQRALRSPTHRLPAYEALGQCFLEQGSFPVAVTVLSRALHEPGLDDEQRVGVLYLLGYACEALQRRDEARSYFQRVYATDIHFRDVAERLAALDGGAR